jgi:hypothetical protein
MLLDPHSTLRNIEQEIPNDQQGRIRFDRLLVCQGMRMHKMQVLSPAAHFSKNIASNRVIVKHRRSKNNKKPNPEG